MLGAILGGLASIVGGAMGGDTTTSTREKTRSRTRQKAQTVTKSNLGQLVRQAEKHGFNPATILSAGGLGAFSKSSTSGNTWSNSMTRGKNVSSSGGPLGAGIAAAGQSIGNAFSLGSANTPDGVGAAGTAWQDYGAHGTDPIAAKAVETDLINAQLSASPGVNATSVDGGNPMLPGSSTWWQATPWGGKTPKFEEGSITHPWPKGSGMTIDAGRQDADVASKRYDEAGGIVAGVSNYAADRATAPQAYDRSEQQFFKDAGTIFNNADRNLLTVLNKNTGPTFQDVADAVKPTYDTVRQRAQSYWDTFEEGHDAAVSHVRSVVDPYIQYQFQPPMEYIGAVDRAGYPRPKW